MMKNTNKRGFTLVEMLVVVLIIGILAAIALPSYQKSVWQSRNAELKSIVKTVRQAADRYYMKTGHAPTSFKALDVVIPGTYSTGEKLTNYTTGNNVCNLANFGDGSVLTGKNFQVVLSGTSETATRGATAVWTDGPYKCGGFDWSKSLGRIRCVEHKGVGEAYGKFCTEVEGLPNTPIQGNGWVFYEMN